MIRPEELVEEEWAEWYQLTPVQRWLESEKLWQMYLALGGSLDPEPDTQSPFFDAKETYPTSKKQLKLEQLLHLHWRVQIRKKADRIKR